MDNAKIAELAAKWNAEADDWDAKAERLDDSRDHGDAEFCRGMAECHAKCASEIEAAAKEPQP